MTVIPMLLRTPLLLLMILPFSIFTASGQAVFSEVDAFEASEAFQAVAVDSSHFYAIDSRAIGKYDKRTGEKVARWSAAEGGGIRHLDSGVIVDGRLYAAHSNYPELPMNSSVEIWDAGTMEHLGSHSFGIRWGSCTWVDRHDGSWWAVFAHYDEFSDRTGKDHRWTTLVQFDDSWRPMESWVLPDRVLKRLKPKSNSGGSWGPEGRLYLSGHDLPELYVVSLPRQGSELKLEAIIPVDNEGQGIAWDRSEPGVVYTITRSSRKVKAFRLKTLSDR